MLVSVTVLPSSQSSMTRDSRVLLLLASLRCDTELFLKVLAGIHSAWAKEWKSCQTTECERFISKYTGLPSIPPHCTSAVPSQSFNDSCNPFHKFYKNKRKPVSPRSAVYLDYSTTRDALVSAFQYVYISPYELGQARLWC